MKRIYCSKYPPLHGVHVGVGFNEHCILLQASDGPSETRLQLSAKEALLLAEQLLETHRKFKEDCAILRQVENHK